MTEGAEGATRIGVRGGKELGAEVLRDPDERDGHGGDHLHEREPAQALRAAAVQHRREEESADGE